MQQRLMDEAEPVSIAVLGKRGQLASALREAADRHPVTSIGRPQVDLARPETLEPALAALSPKVVINAAAYTAVDQAESEPDLAQLINAEAPARLADWCTRAGATLIHISTDYVFDGEKRDPYREGDRPAPAGVYGRTKLEGERGVTAAGPHHVILRTAWVHSPWSGNFVRTMLRLAGTRDELNVVDDQVGNPTYALHLAEAIIAIAERVLAGGEVPGGIFHAAGSGSTSWYGFAREVFACSGRLGGPVAGVHPITTAEYPTAATRPANSRLDCTLLRQTFGLQLAHWKSGVAACVGRLLSASASTEETEPAR